MPTTLRSGNNAASVLERDRVAGIVECRNQNQLVRDIEICIAGREALTVEINRLGHRQRLDAERPAILIFHLTKQGEILLQRLEVRVGRIVLHDGDNRRGIHEPRKIVHVAVRIVARDAVFEPQNVRYAEVVAEDRRQFLARDAGISRLDRTEKALLGGEHRSEAVDVDAAAFQNDAAPAINGQPTFSI